MSIDSLLIALSLDCFSTGFFPLDKSNISAKISQCAKNEIETIFETSNYYERDTSTERYAHSVTHFLGELKKRSIPDPAITYIKHLLILFEHQGEALNDVNNIFEDRINKLLRLEANKLSPDFICAIHKVHENNVFTSSMTCDPWVLDTFRQNTTSWAVKLKDKKLFDGIEDATENLLLEVFEKFSLLSFCQLISIPCNKIEVEAILHNLTYNLINENPTKEKALRHLIAGLTTN
ncbi:hypothetical protein IAE39_003948 [Pseudomonas sp. S37]|uniref:hypothetical protein n=1 Tax=Pseudomonas sp. S37 TaxID=2767449 RepID=UPI001911CE0C|nr:hypothetical protein [Pseudomonas sp. S37]MBK4995774.1 hypothetical protein [Pseudomonas sp. S37]